MSTHPFLLLILVLDLSSFSFFFSRLFSVDAELHVLSPEAMENHPDRMEWTVFIFYFILKKNFFFWGGGGCSGDL